MDTIGSEQTRGIRDRIRQVAAAIVFSSLALIGGPAQATLLELIFSGYLDGRSSIALASATNPVPFAAPTAFTFEAWFDTNSPNLVGVLPFPGFVAYAPSRALLTVAGVTYDVLSFGAATPLGVGVSIFDQRQPFHPGRYGVGFIQNPLADGSGMVADYLGATPNFLTSNLVPTTFTGYQGVGATPGKCITNCPPAPPPLPTFDITPIPMTLGTANYLLRLGFYGQDANPDGSFAFTAQIRAVPEPAPLALLAVGLVGLAFSRRKNP